MRQTVFQIATAAIAVLFLACRVSEESLIGPCVVMYRDPLITIERARDAVIGAAIPRLFVSDVSWGDRQPGVAFLLAGGAEARNAVMEEGRLRCDVSCGFGSSSGTYRLTFQAPGFRDTTLTLAAAYSGGGGNCPAILSNGVRVTLDMQPR